MMETHTPQTEGQNVPPLRRVRENRMIAGVATGIAQRLDIPLWVVRLLFVVLTAFGGLGIALYAIGWLTIPDETESEAIAPRLLRRVDGSTGWVGIGLIGIATLIVLDSVGFRGDVAAAVLLGVIGVLLYRGEIGQTRADDGTDTPPGPSSATPAHTAGIAQTTSGAAEPPDPTVPPTPSPAGPPPPPRPAPPPSILGRVTFAVGAIALGIMGVADSAMTTFDPSVRHYWAAALLVAGIGLLIGGFYGRARGLIALGIVLTPIVFLSPLSDLDLDASVGERRSVPQSLDAIAAEYDLGIGSMTVDFRSVDFDGRTARTRMDLGIGELVVIVPDDIEVVVNAETGIGELEVFGRRQAGVGIETVRTHEGTDGRLDLTIDAGLGSVRVLARDPNPVAASTRLDGELQPGVLNPTYALRNGSWLVDLTSAETLPGRELTSISLQEGTLRLILPEDVSVNVLVAQGTLSANGQEQVGDSVQYIIERADARFSVDVFVGAGAVVIEEGS